MAALEQPLSARLCKPHLERAGVSVPAVFFVASDGFCKSCFVGRTISAPMAGTVWIRSDERLPPRGLMAAIEQPLAWRGPALSARSIERIRHRTLRIRRPSPTKPKRQQPEPQKSDPLTAREMQIVELLAKGLRTADVAAAAGISIRTTKFHISHALAKSGAPDRAGLLLWWVREHEFAQSPDRFGRIDDIERQLAELERAFAELKGSMASGGENCQRTSTS